MNKETIIKTLEEKHHELFEWLDTNGEGKWDQGPKEKWTVGQHILHLVISLKMLNKALSYPKFLIKYKFGVSNRPSRSYSEVAKRYDEKLSKNQERAKEFNKNLKTPSLKEQNRLTDILQIQNKKLQYKTTKLNDKYLDTLLLPHPLMGKMTLREIIMWTAHHTEHHAKILQQKY